MLERKSKSKEPSQINSKDGLGRFLLLLAAERGHAAVVDALLEHDPEAQVKAGTEHGTTAAMVAASFGHASCLAKLLQHCPEEQVKAVRSDGWNALIYAAPGHASCLELLLQHSPEAQVAVMDDDGFSAPTLAALGGHLDCLQLLLAHNPSSQPLDDALERLASRYKTKPSDTLRDCIEQLLALSANSSDPEAFPVLRPIIRDMAQRARLPHLLNEAVVGALAHCSAKRAREE